MIRYPMIFLVVVVHVPRIVGYADEPSFLTFIASFIVDGLARLGIPMLTCISGFFVFHKMLDLNFSLLMRKRFVSLVMPLVIWNMPVVLALYVVQSQGLIDYDFAIRKTMYPFDLMIWVNGVLSITDYPVNYPMHFLRDLFVICFFAPWMGMLLRNIPFLGLIVLLAVFIPNLDGPLIRNDTMIILFYVGGMAATMNWDLKSLDRFAVPLVCLLLLICALVILMRAGHPIWLPLLAPFVVWPASSILLGTSTDRWLISHSRASIFLFMLHGLMLLALKAAFPNLYSTEYALFSWLMTPVLVAVVCQFVYLFLDRIFPAFLIVLMGGRKIVAPKLANTGT